MNVLGSNDLTRALGITLPIVQAPMAGGATTPELVAAVSNAGALGSYAAAYAQPSEIAAAIEAIRQRTDRPFAINVFAPLAAAPPADAGPMLQVVARLYAELGLDPPALPAGPPIAIEEQLAVIREARVPIVSFTFGVLSGEAMAMLKEHGAYLIGTATTVDEALTLQRHGVDAVVAQGSEAGGHRGSFETQPPGGMIGTMALVPQVASTVRTPVVAAGGIMDGRGIVAARALGASAAQLGTAFLTCTESGVPASVNEEWKIFRSDLESGRAIEGPLTLRQFVDQYHDLISAGYQEGTRHTQRTSSTHTSFATSVIPYSKRSLPYACSIS